MSETVPEYITLMNNIYANSLDENSIRLPTPPQIKVPLRDHQQALLAAMVEREQQMMTGIPLDESTFYSRVGVLGDQVGSGKTLVALAHIALTCQQNLAYKRCISDGYQREHTFSIENVVVNPEMGATLIIVPHILYRQWKTAIEKQTSLKCFFCSSKRDLGRGSIVSDIINADCVLVSNTLYRYFDELCRDADIQWKRIYVDEVDSMVMPSNRSPLKAAFIWFLTATWQNVIVTFNHYYPNIILNENLPLEPEYEQYVRQTIGNYKRTYFISYRFFENYMTENLNRYYQVLRTRKRFLDNSLSLPAFSRRHIMCEAPPGEIAVRQFLTPQIREMLNAGNTEGALRSLGVKEESETSLADAVIQNMQKELRRAEQTLAFKQQLEYASQGAKEIALASLEKKIGSLKSQLVSIKERIETNRKADCPVCYESLIEETPILLQCCHNFICSKCVLQYITGRPNGSVACVWCREPINPERLTAVSKKKAAPVLTQIKPGKVESVLREIKAKPEGKFLLFCKYHDIFSKIKTQLEQENITTEILQGNKDMIAAAVDRFRSGASKVLCLQSDIQCAGLNLEAATDIFILHKMDITTEQQIIGRAQRLGRQTSLCVSSFLYPDELKELGLLA
jgi:superfamily II DNA or RNA helicase